MSLPAPHAVPHSPSSDRGPGIRGFLALGAELRREWRVRRQFAGAQVLDAASLRDIGLVSGGVESAIRHGRHRGG